MMTSPSILLATDLSCRGDRALDRATMLASEWKAGLTVLHVLQQPEPVLELSAGEPPDPLLLARRRVQRDLRDAGGVDVNVVIERGDPASRIFDVGERFDCRLIVTGVARDETLGRILLGTTVEKLTRIANVPVLVVKSRPRGPYRNLVVATDFSEGSRSALEAAIALFPHAQLTLFHAVEVSFEGLLDDRTAAIESASRKAEAEARAFVEAIPAAVEIRTPIRILARSGELSAQLEEMVWTEDVDLVVLGTEGRGAAASTLLGSVAQDVLSRLSIDVMVVRRSRD